MPNKELEQSVADANSFIEVIESVDVQVNYKDKIFLDQTKKYKDLKGTQLRTISFADIKMDLGDISLIASLEEEYKQSKTSLAISCNERMEDCVEDAKLRIAEAFVDFMDETISVRKKVKNVNADVYLKKTASKTTCLVYKGGVFDASKSKQNYQFAKLDDLLQTIAEVSVEYCKNVEGKKAPTVPMYIRQSIVLVCYALIDFGDYISKCILRKPIASSTGVQKQIMVELSRRCSELGYPYFVNGDGVFQYDKWSMKVEDALHKDTYVAPLSPVNYAGLKQGYLGYMINQLQRQVPHSVFLDAFAGSGISCVQFPHQDGVKYYVNDYDFANICYYKLLKASDNDFNIFLIKIRYFTKVMLEAYYNKIFKYYNSGTEAGKHAKWILDTVCDGFYGIFREASTIWCIETKRDELFAKDLMSFQPNYDIFPSKVSNPSSLTLLERIRLVYGDTYELPDKVRDVCSGNITYIDIAVVFTIFYNLTISGKDDPSNRPGSKIESLGSIDFNTIFIAIRECYKNIEIVMQDGKCEDDLIGASAMDLLDTTFNGKETLAYLDSPYTGTSSYSVNKADSSFPYKKGTIIKCDDLGKNFISTDFDMEDLMKKCKVFEGNFIFSCRANMVKKNFISATFGRENSTESGKKVILPDSHAEYNNHLWFMKQWMETDYHVLFMVDKGRTISDASFISEGHATCDEGSKIRVLSADWGMDISTEDKEYVYNFLRFMMMTGRDLELMITNFDFKVPDFYNMFEHIINDYNKNNRAALSKHKNASGLIPKDGMFCKMPVRLLADMAYHELYNF